MRAVTPITAHPPVSLHARGSWFATMGGGASKKNTKKAIRRRSSMAGKCEPKHNEPFFLQITLKCADFPLAPLLQSFPDLNQGSTRRKIVVRLRADILPYACENFRLLCTRSVDMGGYIGGEIHDITPGIEFCGGLNSDGRSASAFAGRPFDDLSEEELDHGAYTIGMRSGDQHKPGQFGSQFYICGSAVEDGSVQAALLDEDAGHLVIGEVVDGWVALEMLESLSSSKKWLSAQMKNKKGKVTVATQASAPGGPPACPVVFHEAAEIEGVWTPDTSGAPRGSTASRKGSSFKGSFNAKTHAGPLASIFAADEDDGRNGGAQ